MAEKVKLLDPALVIALQYPKPTIFVWPYLLGFDFRAGDHGSFALFFLYLYGVVWIASSVSCIECGRGTLLYPGRKSFPS